MIKQEEKPMKNKVVVSIAGQEYTLVAVEDEAYVRRCASLVDTQLRAGKAQVTVLTTPDKWYGVTYNADKQQVVEALARMSSEGLYPAPLWD
jgi:cell division protein ZapA (FtsZ GTPase activity inhibitor)